MISNGCWHRADVVDYDHHMVPAVTDGNHELERLRAENARLVALLNAHRIVWRVPDDVAVPAPPRPTYESTTTSMPGTRRYCGCGTDDSADTGRWGIGSMVENAVYIHGIAIRVGSSARQE